MSRRRNILAIVISASFTFALNGCYTQEGSAQDEAASTSESIMQVDGLVVHKLAVESPPVVSVTAATQFVMLPGEAFLPGQTGNYVNSFGFGGACLQSGSNAMSAPVQLPQGAVITGFQVFFNDTSATTDVSVTLAAYNPAGGFYSFLATLTSAGISGFGSKSTALTATVDNTTLGYLVRGFSNAWNCNMKINSALITYSL